MLSPEDWRDEFTATLDHIADTYKKVADLAGPRADNPLRWTDVHKLSEGLFLSAWTHWEQFLRELMVIDVAQDRQGVLRDAKEFRTKGGPERLARRLLDHPDDKKWVEWSDTADIVSRASLFLSAGHRYAGLSTHQNDFEKLRRIRNAVAHKSDRAWESFKSLARGAPFNLSSNQMRGITPGRFLCAHKWGADSVIVAAVAKLEAVATALVP